MLEKETSFHTRYLLKEKIGVGGYSEVWLADDIKTKTQSVLKVFAPDKGLDKNGLQIFAEEYALVSDLNHANLLKARHYDECDGSPYLVLPYCQRGSIFQSIGNLKEVDIAYILRDISSALDFLHNRDPQILHRDISPDNILVSNDGRYLLSDFGISVKIRRTLKKSVGHLETTGGKLAYMPPEYFSRARIVTNKSDIFAFGVTLYLLLEGDLPFGDNGGLPLFNGAEIPDIKKPFSPELKNAIYACLEKAPEDRPNAKQLFEFASAFIQTGQWPSHFKRKPKQKKRAKTERIPVKSSNSKPFLAAFLILALLAAGYAFKDYIFPPKQVVNQPNRIINELDDLIDKMMTGNLSQADSAYSVLVEKADEGAVVLSPIGDGEFLSKGPADRYFRTQKSMRDKKLMLLNYQLGENGKIVEFHIEENEN